MSKKSVAVCRYVLESEAQNLSHEEKIKILTRVAKTHKDCIFTSGEGTQIKLTSLPDDMIYILHDMVKKYLNYE